MSRKTARLSAAALALAAALLAVPAQAASHPSPLLDGWRRLIRLIGQEGLGIDPNGYKIRPINTAGSGGAALVGTNVKTASGASTARR